MEQQNSTIFLQAWKSAVTLGIPDQWIEYWGNYTNALSESHVCIIDGKDGLIWAPTAHGAYSPKEGYPIIHVAHKPPILEGWWKAI